MSSLPRVVRNARLGSRLVAIDARAPEDRRTRGGASQIPAVPLDLAEREKRAAWEAGHRAGRDESRERMAAALELCREAARSLADARSEMIHALEGRLLEALLRMAEAVVRRHIREDRELPARLVREVLQRIDGEGEVEVRVHPEDLAVLEESLGDEVRARVDGLRFVADPAIERGGAVVWWGDRGWDAQSSVQLSWIAELLERWSLEGEVPAGGRNGPEAPR